MKQRELNRIWARTPGEYSAKGMGEQGIALISVILLILVLSFVSAAAIVTSTTELKIGGNFRTSAQSFYNAEAGVQYALGQIRNQYDAGTLDLTVIPVVVHYAAPDTSIYPLLSNGKFPFSNWTTTHLELKTGTTLDYKFQTTGSYASSKTALQVVLNMPSFRLVRGMFASGPVEVKNNLSCVGSPAPEFGSNTSLETKKDEFSKVVLGGDATYSGTAPVQHVPTIPVDPPPGAERIVSDHNYSGSNDNESAGITGDKITATTSLPPGNYYLTDLDTSNLTITGSGAVNIYVETKLSLDNVTINAGSGPLTIYYHGSATVDLKDASLNSGGIASNLSIISDSTDVLFDFKNNAVFSGLIYAPYADINFQNNADVNGLLWGKTITAHNNITFQYDATAASYFGAALIPRILTWKQLQSP